MSKAFRTIKPVYAVIVDGECEVRYFEMIRKNERDLKIHIEPNLATNLPLRKQILKIKEYLQEENFHIYEKIFWVIDYDVIIKETRERTKRKKSKEEDFIDFLTLIQKKYSKKVITIVNNPCLEFWFLLHHKASTRPFTKCVESEKELKKISDFKDYSKQKDYFVKGRDIYQRTKPNLKTAINNSKILGSFDIYNPTKPVCELWKFFEDKNIKSIIK